MYSNIFRVIFESCETKLRYRINFEFQSKNTRWKHVCAIIYCLLVIVSYKHRPTYEYVSESSNIFTFEQRPRKQWNDFVCRHTKLRLNTLRWTKIASNMHYNLAGIAYLRKFLANIELLANQSNFPKPVIIHSIAICKYICSNIFFECVRRSRNAAWTSKWTLKSDSRVSRRWTRILRAHIRRKGEWNKWQRVGGGGREGEAVQKRGGDGESFDNLGHVARRNSKGADGIITVMLLKLRFFGSGSQPSLSLCTAMLSSLINELRTKS